MLQGSVYPSRITGLYGTLLCAHSSKGELCTSGCMAQVTWAQWYPDVSVILACRSPVTTRTARRIEQRLRARGLAQTIVSHPVFLTDGCAVEDFNWPDRILLGTASSAAVMTLKQI